MKTIILGDVIFKIDEIKTREFYADKEGFTSECKDCINYTRKFDLIKDELNGLDKALCIDISKDVGIGMEELRPFDKDDYHLYFVPYYVYAEILNDCDWTIRKESKFVSHKINDNIIIEIEETKYGKNIFDPNKALTLTLIFKTPLVTYEEITKKPPY